MVELSLFNSIKIIMFYEINLPSTLFKGRTNRLSKLSKCKKCIFL